MTKIKKDLDFSKIMQYVEACASCAIEGNKTAKEMLDLWNSGKYKEFIKIVERFNDEEMPNNA